MEFFDFFAVSYIIHYSKRPQLGIITQLSPLSGVAIPAPARLHRMDTVPAYM
jgi:hypothetical protein